MINNISAPVFINILAVLACASLFTFIAARILATAPEIPLPHAQAQSTHAIEQASYSGVISWAGPKEIRITDNFGVVRVLDITGDTHILVHGFPVGAATYANLRILDHVKVTAVDDGSGEKALTIVVQ